MFEIKSIAKIVKDFDGILAVHLRSETGLSADGVSILAALEEMINVGKETGVKIEISHLKFGKPFHNITLEDVFYRLDKAKKNGVDISLDHYPYHAGSTMISFLLPAQYKGEDGISPQLATPHGRNEIIAFLNSKFNIIDPGDILISSYPHKRHFEGLSITEIAQLAKRTPSEIYTDMLFEEIEPWAVFFLANEEDVVKIAKYENIFSISDGWTVAQNMQKPHPRMYGAFPRKIRKFALEKTIIPLPKIIKSMTSLPAERFKIEKRGKLKEGYYADINLIDLSKFSDIATFSDPNQYSVGIKHLFLNGKRLINNYQFEN